MKLKISRQFLLLQTKSKNIFYLRGGNRMKTEKFFFFLIYLILTLNISILTCRKKKERKKEPLQLLSSIIV